MAVQIALLRGINVGSARRVPMAELRRLLESLGYEDVQTYVQSGNILLSSSMPEAELCRELRVQIGNHFGLDVPVLVRTREQLANVVARDPLLGVVEDPKLYQVTFLSAAPAPGAPEAAAALLRPRERVVFSGREVYAWHPEGIHRSKLAGALTDARLGVSATARNWRTVCRLLEMAGG